MGKNLRFLSLAILLLLLGSGAFAQTRTVTGTVTSEDGPMPGVSVLVVGSNKGATTDGDGKYTLELTSTETSLTFSFIGYKTVTVDVANRNVVDVALETDTQSLDEVVIVGYGTMQEKDLTSAITTVKTEELTKTPTSQPMQALQGKVPGVQIVSSGAPGASPTVRIRGIGSMPGQGNSDPLYVVDGMFFTNIDFLNPNDIATISLLKDASAAAIYGVRAANGVVLITTKSGSYNQKTEIVYDGYYGVQRAQNVVQMSNSQQFTQYALATGVTADATYIDAAFARYGRSRVNPNVPLPNTDWYDKVLRTASIQNHSVSINGGKDNVRYSVGGSYFNQEGLLNVAKNEYRRLNFRTKVDFKATDRLTVGVNFNISNARQYVADNGAWDNAYFAVPIMPVFDPNNTTATPVKLANAKSLGYRDPQNPFFNLYYNNDRNNVGKILGNLFWDYQLIPNKLSFKMTYNYSFENINTRNVDFANNNGFTDSQNGIYKKGSTQYNQIIDNVLTYTEDFGDHNITAVAGYTFRSEINEGNYVQGANIATLDPKNEATWYIPTGTIVSNQSGDFGSKLYGSSYFGRVSYNYDDRYLVYSTLRRDGTNKFRKGDKWGNFFTIGGGWVVTEEDFFDVPAIDYLKIRGSWGQLGNDGVASAVGQPTVDPITTAINEAEKNGFVIDNAYDLVNRWETVVETNVGFSARVLKNALSIDLDYYVRNTQDAVLTIVLPAQREIIRRNGGEIKNSGLEAALSYSGKITSDINFTVGANFTTLKNEVTNLKGQRYLDAGQAEFLQRSIVGNSINAFYGFEVEGVFQSSEQINSSGYTAQFISDNNIVPGDFHYKDQNGDGIIDANDRVVLGKILPSFMYGFNLGVTWKGFELTANFQGISGNSILNRKRGQLIFNPDANIDADLSTHLWDGEGSGNKYPSALGLRKSWNLKMSDHFVESGNYFRIQNVRLSYNIIGKELLGIKVPTTKVTFTAERPLTVFQYNGFNPEVANGVDTQTYPIPAVYTLGLNVKF
ncbi:MAG: TonB-dependent receptor [Cyclobacteriaceae bacterium]|nr:TonB-dependent receptor [Cyclobacteriaceae bacterium]